MPISPKVPNIADFIWKLECQKSISLLITPRRTIIYGNDVKSTYDSALLYVIQRIRVFGTFWVESGYYSIFSWKHFARESFQDTIYGIYTIYGIPRYIILQSKVFSRSPIFVSQKYSTWLVNISHICIWLVHSCRLKNFAKLENSGCILPVKFVRLMLWHAHK